MGRPKGSKNKPKGGSTAPRVDTSVLQQTAPMSSSEAATIALSDLTTHLAPGIKAFGPSDLKAALETVDTLRAVIYAEVEERKNLYNSMFTDTPAPVTAPAAEEVPNGATKGGKGGSKARASA